MHTFKKKNAEKRLRIQRWRLILFLLFFFLFLAIKIEIIRSGSLKKDYSVDLSDGLIKMIYSGRVSLVSADLIWRFLWESCCHLDVVWMAASAIVMAFVFVLLCLPILKQQVQPAAMWLALPGWLVCDGAEWFLVALSWCVRETPVTLCRRKGNLISTAGILLSDCSKRWGLLFRGDGEESQISRDDDT